MSGDTNMNSVVSHTDISQKQDDIFHKNPIMFFRNAQALISNCYTVSRQKRSLAIINPNDASQNTNLLNFVHSIDSTKAPVRKTDRISHLINSFEIIKKYADLCQLLMRYPQEPPNFQQPNINPIKQFLLNHSFLNFMNEVLKTGDSTITGHFKIIYQDLLRFISIAYNPNKIQEEDVVRYDMGDVCNDDWQKLTKFADQNIVIGSILAAKHIPDIKSSQKTVFIVMQKCVANTRRGHNSLKYCDIDGQNGQNWIIFQPLNMFKVIVLSQSKIKLIYNPDHNAKIEQLRKLNLSSNPHFYHLTDEARDKSHRIQKRHFRNHIEPSGHQFRNQQNFIKLGLISSQQQTISQSDNIQIEKLIAQVGQCQQSLSLLALAGRNAAHKRQFQQSRQMYNKILSITGGVLSAKNIGVIIQSHCMIATSYLHKFQSTPIQTQTQQLNAMIQLLTKIQQVESTYFLNLDFQKIKILNIMAKYHSKFQNIEKFNETIKKAQEYIKGENDKVCNYEKIRLMKTQADHHIRMGNSQQAIKTLRQIQYIEDKMNWLHNQNLIRAFQYYMNMAIIGYYQVKQNMQNGYGVVQTVYKEVKKMRERDLVLQGNKSWQYIEFLYHYALVLKDARKFQQSIGILDEVLQMLAEFPSETQKKQKLMQDKTACEAKKKWADSQQ